LVLAVLTGSSEIRNTGEAILLRLPFPYPVSVSSSDGTFRIQFSGYPPGDAQKVKAVYDSAVERITKGMVLVCKFMNVIPSVISDTKLAELGRRFLCVIVKSRYTYDRTMGACDATITALIPRWEETLIEQLQTEFERILQEGTVRLCQKCYSFFAAGRSELRCPEGSEHLPYNDQYSTMHIYSRRLPSSHP
jgi:hypothetical protein